MHTRFSDYNLFRIPLFLILLLCSLASLAESSAPLAAEFKEIRETSFGAYGIYTISNVGDQDIDDVVLSLYLKNTDGETLSSTAVTDATPGLVWMKAGASHEEGVPLDRRAAARALLENNPEQGDLVIEVKSISYME